MEITRNVIIPSRGTGLQDYAVNQQIIGQLAGVQIQPDWQVSQGTQKAITATQTGINTYVLADALDRI